MTETLLSRLKGGLPDFTTDQIPDSLFFAATIGVGLYSNIDMISSLCILMARGALISMVVVIFVLPSMFMVFDKIIVKTSKGFLPKEG